MYNEILERIHQVLGNLLRTFNISFQAYIDEDDQWTSNLAASAFSIHSTNNRQKGYSPVQLIFGRDMILPIKHKVAWEIILQNKIDAN